MITALAAVAAAAGVLLGWRAARHHRSARPRGGPVLAVPPPVRRLLGPGALAVALAVLWPPLPVLLGMVWLLRRRRQALVASRAAHRELVSALSPAADLALIAARAGLTAHQVVAVLCRSAPPPVARPLATAVQQAAGGRLLADTLAEVPAHSGEPFRPLVTALAAGLRTGGPLVPGLDAAAVEARRAHAQAAALAARRVSVQLLFPLVVCVLPAFVVLGLVPLLVASLQGVRLPS